MMANASMKLIWLVHQNGPQRSIHSFNGNVLEPGQSGRADCRNTFGLFCSQASHSVSPSCFLTSRLWSSNHISTLGSPLFAGEQAQISQLGSLNGAKPTDETADPKTAILRAGAGSSFGASVSTFSTIPPF